MSENIYFKGNEPYLLSQLFKDLAIDKEAKVLDINTLINASENDLSFYDSLNYKENASKTQQGQERVCSAASIIVYNNTSG